jgi:hypothetical protein
LALSGAIDSLPSKEERPSPAGTKVGTNPKVGNAPETSKPAQPKPQPASDNFLKATASKLTNSERPEGDNRDSKQILKDSGALSGLFKNATNTNSSAYGRDANPDNITQKLEKICGDGKPGSLDREPDAMYRASQFVEHFDKDGNGMIDGYTKDAEAIHGTEAGQLQDATRGEGYGAIKDSGLERSAKDTKDITAKDIVDANPLLKNLSPNYKELLKLKVGDFENDTGAARDAVHVLGKIKLSKNADGTERPRDIAKDSIIHGIDHRSQATQGTEAELLVNYLKNGEAALKSGKLDKPDNSPVTTGLGKEVDDIVNQSPTLQAQIRAFLKTGGQIVFEATDDGEVGNSNDVEIVIDEDQKDPKAVVGILGHEVGHTSDGSKSAHLGIRTKEEYAEGKIRAEAVANFNAAKVEDELDAKGIHLEDKVSTYGYGDIEREAFDQYKKDGNKDAAIDKIADHISAPDNGPPGENISWKQWLKSYHEDLGL